jgi:methionine aminotransferase
VHQFTTFAVNTPVQHAIADFLRSDPEFYEALPAFYQEKRDLFCTLLGSSRFRLHPARSTFFQIVDYGEISNEDDTKLAKRWTTEIGVASIPLTVFCEQPFTGSRLRFCFAKDDATLSKACELLSEL